MTQIPVAIGASTSCTDGPAGHVVRVVVNPVGLTRTGIIFTGSFRWTSPRSRRKGSV